MDRSRSILQTYSQQRFSYDYQSKEFLYKKVILCVEEVTLKPDGLTTKYPIIYVVMCCKNPGSHWVLPAVKNIFSSTGHFS